VRALVEALASAGVRYVITGSVAAYAWTGHAEPPPGDLDIAPELSAENLSRLAALLARCGARPVHRPDWKRTLSPEECARWRPEPATAAQLDHQLVTPWGLLDVVPKISGEYERLIERAAPVKAWGFRVALAHPEDLRATIQPDRQEKHRARTAILAEACERAARGAGPVGLGPPSAGRGSGSMPPLRS
jgi:hypothetical protein